MQRVVSAAQVDTGDAWHWDWSDATPMHGLDRAHRTL